MSTRPQHLYEFGPYRLDTAEQLLLRDGAPVPLTPKAFETLVALVERSGHLVEKEELMKVVWSDAFVEESNLTNNVYALRKMLGQGENGRSYIETVPKRGYRFTASVKELPLETLVVERRTLTRVVTEEAVADHSRGQSIIGTGEALAVQHAPAHAERRSKSPWLLVALLLVALSIGGFFIYRSLPAAPPSQIQSIAVLPFKNESGNADVEYLSDGVTESLINSLSQLSNLSVKARSTVFRYKDKTVEPQTVAAELSVQAILTGRVVQRGDDLTLYLSLIDGRNGNQLWGQRYDRKVADLVALQNEIGHDVSRKLRLHLSAGDEQKLKREYTSNAKAYQLYLRGRYHALKRTLPETLKAISYFQQAIAIDPFYALAYVGLADAHVSSLAASLPSNEVFPQARAAAQKAIELDDTLAAAHAQLGFIIFWYDWDWGASENKFKRALELDPDGPDTHVLYAHLLSNTGRHAEALAEAKRARELDPLNLRINALEAQFLIHAGRTDEALTRLQETLEMDTNYFLAHLYCSSAYIEKGMYSEAISEARRAREISGARSTHSEAFLGYALAKSGKEAEARSVLDGLLKSSAERYVSPYHIALVYNGLGEHDEALAWLERAYADRSPGMVFLKVEPKWNNLRSDARFQDLLRRVGLS
jgi:TolB-like protein/DNA-binding winged helix-turn-helix (wHTH) protein/Tfp pilus assembly protein PilF